MIDVSSIDQWETFKKDKNLKLKELNLFFQKLIFPLNKMATLLEGAGHRFEKQFPIKLNILFFGVLSVYISVHSFWAKFLRAERNI